MGKIDSQRLLDVPKADRLNKTPVAGIAQCGSGGRRFNSGCSPHISQWVS